MSPPARRTGFHVFPYRSMPPLEVHFSLALRPLCGKGAHTLTRVSLAAVGAARDPARRGDGVRKAFTSQDCRPPTTSPLPCPSPKVFLLSQTWRRARLLLLLALTRAAQQLLRCSPRSCATCRFGPHTFSFRHLASYSSPHSHPPRHRQGLAFQVKIQAVSWPQVPLTQGQPTSHRPPHDPQLIAL